MRHAQVRTAAILGGLLWLASMGNILAEQGFDEKYQCDFNIFNPINAYDPANPARYRPSQAGRRTGCDFVPVPSHPSP